MLSSIFNYSETKSSSRFILRPSAQHNATDNSTAFPLLVHHLTHKNNTFERTKIVRPTRSTFRDLITIKRGSSSFLQNIRFDNGASKALHQTVKKPFHISMAALDYSTSSDEPAQVMCGYDGRNYLLCTLRKPDVMQCPLDLNFEVGDELSLPQMESVMYI
ncbi:unnamed protein product [Callosobruchus maculatus]|uniref:Nucleoplasmin-like domain-containing protein n=1 Tax=Callosobruchus maculatus TaxID=64391 RepID=A0A653DFF2_CALMS|nr:unnamed protein product [Callosobruchus maculatus]